MNYKEFIFSGFAEGDYHRDLIINSLGEIGFDTFEETESGFKAYIIADQFDQKQFDEVLHLYANEIGFTWEANLIAQKNWNQVWESNFEPLEIGSCYVRATFHSPRPDFLYEIVIDPKMAFGTGHHETTSMMMELMQDEDFTGKRVLDMGCGTGILAILASLLGAEHITAIDFDPLCYESTLENAQLNNVNNIGAICGSKEVIPAGDYDIILANINRNILLDQLPEYQAHLKEDGTLFMSGFYDVQDMEIIASSAASLGLSFVTKQKKKDWVAAKFKRPA